MKQKQMINTKQSRLGEQLSESTTRRVVVLVLLMVCILPFFDVPIGNYAPQFSTEFLHSFNLDSTIPDAAKQTVLDTYIDNLLYTSDGRDALLRGR